MKLTKEFLESTANADDGAFLFDDQIEQILQDQKLREIVENDIKRCRGELRCEENEKLADHLDYLLEESKN